MNPDVFNVLLNLASSGLYSFLCLGGKKVSELAIGKELQTRWENEKVSVAPRLRRAIHLLAEDFKWTYDKGEEVTTLFLCSCEVEELMRQLYSVYFTHGNVTQGNGLTSLRTLFSTLFLQFMSQYPSQVIPEPEEQRIIADALFDELVKISNVTLAAAADQGLLSAHEALSTYRYHIVQGQLASIQKRLDFFVTSQQSLDVPAILQYEKRYRKQVEGRHGLITPPHFDAARQIPINDLYVFPTLKSVIEKGGEKEQEKDLIESITDFLFHVQRTVVLGNPGGGKSTLAQKICHYLTASGPVHQFIGSRQLTPVLVILRKYGVAKQEHRCSIHEYIETEFEATYQLPSPPLHTLEYLLLNGHILVIFDGLDELLDTSSRQEIRDDVQSFCNLYPSTPVLITSREVGYEQAPLRHRVFQVLRLENLNDQQVSEYAQKWFMIADPHSPLNERQQKAKNFLEESLSVSDLRSNPLMLALMCNIYRGENYIPRNRPEVYQKCADMLFERWDKSRNIHALLPFEEHIRPTMMYLAHWIYTSDSLRAGVTEQLLVDKATDYLHQKRFADRDEAEQAARKFISSCRGRAWVFTDIGTEKGGERLYQFTHQTFLEYFTAVFLVRTYTTPERLLESLLPRIEGREWDVVAQLAIHRQHRQSEDAGDQLLSLLLAYAGNVENKKQWNVLDFTVRCLQFIVPSPWVVRNVVEKLVLKSIQRGSERKKQEDSSLYPDVKQTFNNLSSAALENHIQIAHTIEQSIADKISNGKDEEKISALVLSSSLRNSSLWSGIQQYIKQLPLSVKRSLYVQSPLLCRLAIWENTVTLVDFIKWHGFAHVFKNHSHALSFGMYLPLSMAIVRDIIFGNRDRGSLYFEQACDIIERVGDLVPNIPTYIYKDFQLNLFFTQYIRQRSGRGKFKELKQPVIFGIFVLFAGLAENSPNTLEEIHPIEENNSEFYEFLQYVVSPRNKSIEQELTQKQLDKLKFSQEQQAVIWKWIKKKATFGRPSVKPIL